jgi:hypothetical protein
MRHITLQALTWGTVAAAVSSALWLAASEPGWPEARKYPSPRLPGLRAISQPSAEVDVRRVGVTVAERGQRPQPR